MMLTVMSQDDFDSGDVDLEEEEDEDEIASKSFRSDKIRTWKT